MKRGLLLLAGVIVCAQTISADARAEDAAVTASCVEHLPEGATRPKLVETMPERGVSGFEVRLTVVIEHGKGETVLPNGFEVQREGIAHESLKSSSFVLPAEDGGSAPTLSTEVGETSSKTTLTIPVVPLPKTAGRHELVLPPLPVAVARASGDVMTLCTEPHPLLAEDPVVNEASPEVKANPPPRSQREDWELARRVALGMLIGLPIGAALVALFLWWRRRPKYVPPPPPIPPWITALAELREVRASDLLKAGKTDDYFDRVSDAVRKYLGARYGYDGLESTTDEALAVLKAVVPKIAEMPNIQRFLERCDLVKFANVVPNEEDCDLAINEGEQIVRRTIPEPRDVITVDDSPEGGDA